MVLNLLKYVIMKNITYIATALLVSVGSSSASLWVDFNSNQAGGGAPVSGNPADATNAAHNDSAYQSYHAAHENAAGFVTATYSTSFANTGATSVTLTPSWSNTTDRRVQQSISRGNGNNAQYTNPGSYSVELVRDWIGVDARANSGGNGNFDGTTGTSTFIELTLGGLPAANYNWISLHHDTENVFTNFNVYVDTGSGFALAGSGYQADSSAGGNPDSGENRTDGPANTFNTAFTSTGGDVALRFEPLSGELGAAVHNQLFAINGFQLAQAAQVPEPSTGLLGLLGAGLLLRRRR